MSRVLISRVVRSFGEREVLRGVDLDVADGEFVAVLGASGCGKTTLLRILAGFLDADEGEVVFDGTTVSSAAGSVPAWERKVGYVPQEGALFPHLDVRDNILFGLRRRERTHQRLLEMLDLAELPVEIASSYPRELSGGQQQRVALARALAPRPRVVLLDEPFSSLDAALRSNAGREVSRVLRNAGSTALLVTHDQGEALSLADRVAVMAEGRIVQVDSPTRLYGAPADVGVGTFVGDANLLPAVLDHDTATSALGLVHLTHRPAVADGETITLLVRPEQLRLSAPAAGEVLARVQEVDFYGPHATVRLHLEDGTILRARTAPRDLPAVGSWVAVAVTGVTGAFG